MPFFELDPGFGDVAIKCRQRLWELLEEKSSASSRIRSLGIVVDAFASSLILLFGAAVEACGMGDLCGFLHCVASERDHCDWDSSIGQLMI